MGGEITATIKGGLRKSAKEVLEHTDELKKTAKNADEAKQIDEVIEHLDGMAKSGIPMSPPGGKGFLEGQKLSRQEIKLWINKIDEISNGKAVLRIIDETDNLLAGKQAGFNPFTQEVFLKKGFTEYEIFHEFSHLEEFMKLGKDDYIKGMKVISGNLELDLIRTYKREMYVYNKILENGNKFNKKELLHAYEENILPVLDKLKGAGIDANNIKL